MDAIDTQLHRGGRHLDGCRNVLTTLLRIPFLINNSTVVLVGIGVRRIHQFAQIIAEVAFGGDSQAQ